MSDDFEYDDDDSEDSLEEGEACKECGGDAQGSDCDDCTEPLCSGCNVTGNNFNRRCDGCENYRGLEEAAKAANITFAAESGATDAQVFVDGLLTKTLDMSAPTTGEALAETVAAHDIKVWIADYSMHRNIDILQRRYPNAA